MAASHRAAVAGLLVAAWFAIADGATMRRASAFLREEGRSAAQYLGNNDSYHFFQRLGDLLVSGPTNTNVNDLTFTFVF